MLLPLGIISTTIENMSTTPIDAALDFFGGQQKMADALGVTQSAISQWKVGGRPLSLRRCVEIQRLTNGAVRAEDLRPDMADVIRAIKAEAK
jgi:DNA-binding transcriptional regulator YdaS (Cro superfamily)